jgi:endonuclease III
MTDTKARIGPKDLGIDLGEGTDPQLFRWLVACALFGARIRQEIAAQAFRELDGAGLLTPRKLASAPWQRVVDLLGRGGYRRYDESTARQLIATAQQVLDRYDGQLSRLPDGADGAKEVAERVQAFTGVGPKASEIFLRELSGLWPL